jgi:hypothetical protein
VIMMMGFGVTCDHWRTCKGVAGGKYRWEDAFLGKLFRMSGMAIRADTCTVNLLLLQELSNF